MHGLARMQDQVADVLNLRLGEPAILLPEIAPQRHRPLGRIDELNLTAPRLALAIGQHPDVGRNTGVVEDVLGQRDDGFEPVVLYDPATDVALALTGIPREQRRAVMHLDDATADPGRGLHLRELVDQEHELPIAGTGDHPVFRVAAMLGDEAQILELLAAAQAVEIRLPALAVRRIGEHEMEIVRRERIRAERGAVADVVRLGALTLEQQVGLGDGVGFRLDLLAVEMDGDVLAVLPGQLGETLLGQRQHAARTAGTVIDQIGAGFEAVGDRQKDQVGHERHHVARGEVLAGLFVVLLVETADQLLEDRAHGMVVERGQSLVAILIQDGLRAEIDPGIQELADEMAEDVGLDQRRDLVAELEFVEDLLDVGGKAVQIRLEVGLELLMLGAVLQIAQREG